MLFWPLFSKRRIYLDYAAATPVHKDVLHAMKPYWQQNFANASAINSEGVVAAEAVEGAREKIARTLGVTPDDITFTSGGTESNNLALRGFVARLVKDGVDYPDIEIVTTAVEHPSILETIKALEVDGCRIKYVPVDEDGLIKIEEFKGALSSKTRLVTIAYANSETGVVQDIGKLNRVVKAFAREEKISIVFHTDAAQAPLWLQCRLESLGVDMMTLDTGKCEGPKGLGVLVHRPTVRLLPIMFGGSQEGGLRPGTEPTSLVVGAATAIRLAVEGKDRRVERVIKIRDAWLEELEQIDGVILNGSRTERLPNNVNISVPGLDSEYLVVTLDAAGIAASTRSACSGAGGGYSHVVYEMTGDKERASSTVRFTLGSNTTSSDLSKVTKVLKDHKELMKSV